MHAMSSGFMTIGLTKICICSVYYCCMGHSLIVLIMETTIQMQQTTCTTALTAITFYNSIIGIVKQCLSKFMPGFQAPILPGILMASLFPAIIGSRFPGAVYATQTLNFRAPAQVGN